MYLTLSMYVVQHERTALLYASEHGHTSVVEVLLDRGADIHHKDKVREREGGHCPVRVWENI